MSDTSTIYLSGAIKNLESDGRNWRQLVEEVCPEFEYENPLDYHDPRDETTIIFPNHSPAFIEEQEETVDAEEVVEKDKELLWSSNAALVNWEHDVVSVGTDMEVIYAYERVDIPVVVWTDVARDEAPLWLRCHSDFLSPSFEQCIFFLQGALA